MLCEYDCTLAIQKTNGCGGCDCRGGSGCGCRNGSGWDRRGDCGFSARDFRGCFFFGKGIRNRE